VTALNFMKALCDDGMTFCRLTTNSHYFTGNIRIKFTFMNGVEKLFERFGDPDSDVRKTALICVTALCVHGIVFTKLPSSDSHNFPDDIRSRFISSNGLGILIEKVEDLDGKVRETALDCVKTLCVQGITFHNVMLHIQSLIIF